MQFYYSEVEGHILAARGASSSRLSHVAHDYECPLKQGLHMIASLILLSSSLGLMYFTTLFVSDLQQHETFSQSASMEALDHDFSVSSYHDLNHGQDF